MNELLQSNCPKMPWMIEFHSTDGNVFNQQLDAAFASDQIEYLTNLNMNSKTSNCRLTIIVCTITPDNSDVDTLVKLLTDGMNVAKLNLSYLTQEECSVLIDKLKNAVDVYSEQIGTVYPLAIAIDTKGSVARTGHLENPYDKYVELIAGEFVQVTTDDAYKNNCTDKIIYINQPQFQRALQENDIIYLDGDKIILQVIRPPGRQFIDCVIKVGGKLYSRVNANVPNCPLKLEAISEADKLDIIYAAENGIDAIFISNVDLFDTVYKIRLLLNQHGAKKTLLFAKIESLAALRAIELIIKACDGIIICRNTIASELVLEKRFIVQKQIVGLCMKAGIPVICPSELYSASYQKPTRAECTDAATAIFDGIDGLCTGREVGRSGDNILNAVRCMNRICLEAESAIFHKKLYEGLTKETLLLEHVYVVGICCVEASIKSNASAIIILTTSGRTAKIVSHYKPRCPVIAVTRFAAVARTLNLYRGLKPVLYLKPPLPSWRKDINERFQVGITYGKFNGWIKGGSTLVLLQGYTPGAGHTNAMRVVYASDIDQKLPENEIKAGDLWMHK